MKIKVAEIFENNSIEKPSFMDNVRYHLNKINDTDGGIPRYISIPAGLGAAAGMGLYYNYNDEMAQSQLANNLDKYNEFVDAKDDIDKKVDVYNDLLNTTNRVDLNRKFFELHKDEIDKIKNMNSILSNASDNPDDVKDSIDDIHYALNRKFDNVPPAVLAELFPKSYNDIKNSNIFDYDLFSNNDKHSDIINTVNNLSKEYNKMDAVNWDKKVISDNLKELMSRQESVNKQIQDIEPNTHFENVKKEINKPTNYLAAGSIGALGMAGLGAVTKNYLSRDNIFIPETDKVKERINNSVNKVNQYKNQLETQKLNDLYKVQSIGQPGNNFSALR